MISVGDNETAALRYLLLKRKKGFSYLDLRWIFNRVNFELFEKYDMYIFSQDFINKLYFSEVEAFTAEMFEMDNYLIYISQATVETIDAVYTRWRLYGRWLTH